ncbi:MULTISPECIES: haloacid dehalogenase type II [unclassified Streptomyces]|uniref:haloacid dehalogenase type II n=1 Tax=unclassified Streptomyces TaxID=2593676 RepID=UPI00404384A8
MVKSPATGGTQMMAVSTLLFDVFGTVVDLRGSLNSATRSALSANDMDPERAQPLVEMWLTQLNDLMTDVRSKRAAWKSHDALMRDALHNAVRALEMENLPQQALRDLASASHRLPPWPDSPRSLSRLADSFAVVALSNASFSGLTRLSAAGRLRWHCVLSSEAVKTYKPDPAVYRHALDILGLDPGTTMMVAAHEWDLRAAAEHGIATAFLSRPGEAEPSSPGDFNVQARDLSDLADQLTG